MRGAASPRFPIGRVGGGRRAGDTNLCALIAVSGRLQVRIAPTSKPSYSRPVGSSRRRHGNLDALAAPRRRARQARPRGQRVPAGGMIGPALARSAFTQKARRRFAFHRDGTVGTPLPSSDMDFTLDEKTPPSHTQVVDPDRDKSSRSRATRPVPIPTVLVVTQRCSRVCPRLPSSHDARDSLQPSRRRG